MAADGWGAPRRVFPVALLRRERETRSAMPPFQTYNPIIIGFVEGKGYLNIPLRTARDKYRQLSSDF